MSSMSSSGMGREAVEDERGGRPGDAGEPMWWFG